MFLNDIEFKARHVVIILLSIFAGLCIVYFNAKIIDLNYTPHNLNNFQKDVKRVADSFELYNEKRFR